jgi:hypothetical protein
MKHPPNLPFHLSEFIVVRKLNDGMMIGRDTILFRASVSVRDLSAGWCPNLVFGNWAGRGVPKLHHFLPRLETRPTF